MLWFDDNGSFKHWYDLHGIAAVASQVRLPELGYFRTQAHTAAPDIEIRVGNIGRKPQKHVTITSRDGDVRYQEHLGALGANFSVNMGDRIRVTVAPLLAASPHVVYTNVVEALLRFVMASRGFALLHSATVRIDGRGVMLSAQTDTGKTCTILRMLRENGGTFLSDDMSIIGEDGRVFSYPKPLTISAHTLQAIDRDKQSVVERLVLLPKSYLHSKQGRGAGMALSKKNLPIMSMNAITQAIVPPPKYRIEQLVPCETTDSTNVERLFLIARGPRRDEAVGRSEALDDLTRNTDDAYGFPPFSQLAPLVVLGDEDYHALRARERSVIWRLLQDVRVHRMVRDDFSWADDIPVHMRSAEPVELTPRVEAPAEVAQRAA